MSDIPINQIVDVNISISGGGAQAGNFGLACIFGDSEVIPPNQRYLSFSNFQSVAEVFPENSEEYKQAEIFTSQNPYPIEFWIARWIKTDAAGFLKTDLTTTGLSSLLAINDGSLKIAFDGVAEEKITGLDFTTVSSWSDVAAEIQAGIRAIATGGFTLATVSVIQNSSGVQFIFTSGTAGVSSSVSVPTSALMGTDLVALLNLGTGTPIDGADAETAAEAIQAVQAINDSFFGVIFTNTLRDDVEVLSVAAYIQTQPKTFFTVTQQAAVKNPSDQTSFAYQSKQLGYSHTLFIYSDIDQYVDASIMSTMFTVDFSGTNTVKNPNFQATPGIVPVNLSTSDLNAIRAVNCNTVISVKGVSFFTDGRMSGFEKNALFFFDTMHFLYWLQDYIGTNMLNLYLSQTVPYSDTGVQMEVQNLSNSLEQGVINGGLSALSGANNTTIPAYYVLPPARVATVPLSQRSQRRSPNLQFTANGSSAINSVTINGTLTA